MIKQAKQKLRICIYDNDVDVLQYFEFYFFQQPNYKVICVEKNFVKFREKIKRQNYIDVLFLGINSSNPAESLRLLQQIKSAAICKHIVVISEDIDESLIMECFQKGIRGFLERNDGLTFLHTYLECIEKGGVAISPSVMKVMIQYYNFHITYDSSSSKGYELDAESRIVLGFLCLNYSIERIALTLNLSNEEVQYHLIKIYHFLDVRNRYKEQLNTLSEITRVYERLTEMF